LPLKRFSIVVEAEATRICSFLVSIEASRCRFYASALQRKRGLGGRIRLTDFGKRLAIAGSPRIAYRRPRILYIGGASAAGTGAAGR